MWTFEQDVENGFMIYRDGEPVYSICLNDDSAVVSDKDMAAIQIMVDALNLKP